MIKLDLNNSKLNFNRNIKPYQWQINKIHNKFMNKELPGYEFTDWVDWPVKYNKDEVEEINSKVRQLHQEGVQTLVVIGIGGSFLGAKAGIDFVKGSIDSAQDVIFVGTDLSSNTLKQVERQIENKKWALAIISKSGTTLEPALSFRYFRNLIESKYDNANDYIIVITDAEKGKLHELSLKRGYTKYIVPDGIGGRFSGTTPVGLFPMAFAGINIKEVLLGAEKAREHYRDSKLENNEAYRYAIARHYFFKKKYSLMPNWFPGTVPLNFWFKMQRRRTKEVLVGYETDMHFQLEWIKQLFGESEGKEGKGLYPTSAIYTRDLHSLGQIIQEGHKDFIETTLWIKNSENNIKVPEISNDDDGLNYVAGQTFEEINKKAFEGIVKAHSVNGKIPNIIIKVKDRKEQSLGYMWYFFFMTTMMTSYLQGNNPFNQPGVEVYKKEIFKKLEKPE